MKWNYFRVTLCMAGIYFGIVICMIVLSAKIFPDNNAFGYMEFFFAMGMLMFAASFFYITQFAFTFIEEIIRRFNSLSPPPPE